VSDRAPDAASDEELVAAWVRGDRSAFDELVRRYERRVFGICYRYFGNAADAEDAAQDAFIALLRRASTFTGASSFSTWMYRVATNACNDLARKRARRPQAATDGMERLAATAATDDALANRELGLELSEALAALEPEHREAVVLHDVMGLTHAEIAERHGVAVGTVKSRVHRAHARLADLLVAAGTEPRSPIRPQTEQR
jgi:RNA polymerase sigma-70 factor, ECF subfamily